MVIVTILATLLAFVFSKIKISDKESKMHYMTFAPISQLRTNTVLPHFLTYIIHAVVLITIVASAFFCVLYSLPFGKNQARIWILTFFFGFLLNVFILQPLEVLVSAILSIFYYKINTDLLMYYNIFPKKEYLRKTSKEQKTQETDEKVRKVRKWAGENDELEKNPKKKDSKIKGEPQNATKTTKQNKKIEKKKRRKSKVNQQYIFKEKRKT